jgi:hypothetical protein
MRKLAVILAFALASAVWADTVTLKSGRVVNGTYLGGTARQVRVEVGDNIETFDVGEVATIQFTGPTSAAAEQRPERRVPPPARQEILRPEPAPAEPPPSRAGVELPAGHSRRAWMNP